jgi:cation diffusion facilitator CzcD-associated flavoprotein CzcO
MLAIIGAGSSGITAAKAMTDARIPFDCFEKSDRVGGNWVFGNTNGMSSAYRGLYINTSRDRMQYADYPMPPDYPDFPHHTHIARYFDAYVDRFDLRRRISFETSVKSARRGDAGGWVLEVERDGRTEERRYDALLVANGHHWDPRWPEPPFPGKFAGEVLHAHHYVDSLGWSGKRVVVVGMGNSAMDIAVEASYVADRVFLAARRGAWIIPKYMFGKPLDQISNSARVPFAIKRKMFETLLKVTVGDMERYGLPRPDHRFGEAHPTVSGRILDRLSHGAITPKKNLAELLGDRVRFDDGTEEKADVIVYCTGYKVTFPFFDSKLLEAKDNDLPLFRRVFEPRFPDLFFVGLCQPLGAIMPLAEAQAKWIAEYLTGRYALPERPALLADVEKERAAMFARYVKSKRHTMQVDFDEYMLEMHHEIERGHARAKKRGNALPIAARAAASR